MLIAEKKRVENIAEYIIHMYKTEDLLRAFEFDPDQLYRYMIVHLPLNEEEKARELEWYRDIIEKMNHDDEMMGGHLIEVQEIVAELEGLHEKLRKSDAEYIEILNTARSDLDQYLKIANDDTITEVQLCLNALYGYMLLKLENKTVFDTQKETVEKFGSILSYLSFKFRED